ncbi:MAG: hypothetical protein D4R97_04690 [Bacteroidetes bacterium]|nr:MAG: hypothetical protein D4R97_04690 [Bacteroidota bacterium]
MVPATFFESGKRLYPIQLFLPGLFKILPPQLESTKPPFFFFLILPGHESDMSLGKKYLIQ